MTVFIPEQLRSPEHYPTEGTMTWHNKDDWFNQMERLHNEAGSMTFERFAAEAADLDIDRQDAWRLWKEAQPNEPIDPTELAETGKEVTV